MGGRTKEEQWTKSMAAEHAAGFESRTEWQVKHNKSYAAAHRNGWLDELTTHMKPKRVSRTLEDCQHIAAGYSTINEWQVADPNSYMCAYRRKWLEECCGHMERKIKPHGYWTEEKCSRKASKYRTRKDWVRGDNAAYIAAQRNGWVEVCSRHMVSGYGSTDNDAIYIWEAVGETYNGEQVYKIGVTSARLDGSRIAGCAANNGQESKIVILAQTIDKATDIEARLLELGSDPQYVGLDGYTEYRALSTGQLAEALNIINEEIHHERYNLQRLDKPRHMAS